MVWGADCRDLRFPDSLSTSLRAKVSDIILDGSWVLREDFKVQFQDICLKIERIAISLVEDSLVWSLSRDDSVSCKTAYCEMIQKIIHDSMWKDIWSSFIPLSRSALSWCLLINRLHS